MYPIVVVIHEPPEWLGLEVTGAEATPMWAGEDGNTQGPLIESFSDGQCHWEARVGVVDGFF